MKFNCAQFHSYSKGVYIPAQSHKTSNFWSKYLHPCTTDIRLWYMTCFSQGQVREFDMCYIWLEALRATAPFNQFSPFSPIVILLHVPRRDAPSLWILEW